MYPKPKKTIKRILFSLQMILQSVKIHSSSIIDKDVVIGSNCKILMGSYFTGCKDRF